MRKKKYDREEADRRSKRQVIFNWILMLVSGALIIICRYFL